MSDISIQATVKKKKLLKKKKARGDGGRGSKQTQNAYRIFREKKDN